MQPGHDPRNNFALDALICGCRGILPRAGGFVDVANILIVDDDPAVQLTIRLLLERAGHHVTVAGDGRKGLALFESSPFDLLFLDIFMPGMDGLETMRHVRALRSAELRCGSLERIALGVMADPTRCAVWQTPRTRARRQA